MQLPLYTRETAGWYALINRAQAESNSYFHKDVEDYLVHLLAYVDSELTNVHYRSSEANGLFPYTPKQQRLAKIKNIGEQCLLIAGLFPDHANLTGIPLLFMMERGYSAYRELADATPEVSLYSNIADNYGKVIDLLQNLGEMCGDYHKLDLIQAVELWQETGSRHGWNMIKKNIGAFPASTGSELQH